MIFEKRKVTTEDARNQLIEMKKYWNEGVTELIKETLQGKLMYRVQDSTPRFEFNEVFYKLCDIWPSEESYKCLFKVGVIESTTIIKRVEELSLENKLTLIDVINKSI